MSNGFSIRRPCVKYRLTLRTSSLKPAQSSCGSAVGDERAPFSIISMVKIDGNFRGQSAGSNSVAFVHAAWIGFPPAAPQAKGHTGLALPFCGTRFCIIFAGHRRVSEHSGQGNFHCDGQLGHQLLKRTILLRRHALISLHYRLFGIGTPENASIFERAQNSISKRAQIQRILWRCHAGELLTIRSARRHANAAAHSARQETSDAEWARRPAPKSIIQQAGATLLPKTCVQIHHCRSAAANRPRHQPARP